jgi:hypothetical protein
LCLSKRVGEVVERSAQAVAEGEGESQEEQELFGVQVALLGQVLRGRRVGLEIVKAVRERQRNSVKMHLTSCVEYQSHIFKVFL